MPGENLGWMDLERFLAIHERCMEDVEEYFVLSHDLYGPIVRRADLVRFSGMMHCLDGIEIHVFLELRRDERNRVRGRRFQYHAQLRIPPDNDVDAFRIVNILRYDNASHFRSHPDAFHKHLFADDGSPIGVEHVGRQDFPALRNVIDEVFEWWKVHQGKPPLAT